MTDLKCYFEGIRGNFVEAIDVIGTIENRDRVLGSKGILSSNDLLEILKIKKVFKKEKLFEELRRSGFEVNERILNFYLMQFLSLGYLIKKEDEYEVRYNV